MARPRTGRTTRSQTRLLAETSGVPGRTRSEESRTRLHRGWAISVLLLLLSCTLLGVYIRDDRFAVARVEVEGATLVDAAQIAATADLYGKPIFLLNTRRLESVIEDTYGCFERVRVQSRLPNQVTIEVVEKGAMLLWEQRGNYWWLDGEGKVLSTAAGRGDLPVIHDRSDLTATVGQVIAGVPWDYVARMLEALPAVKDFEYTLQDGLIVFVTLDRWPVYLGSDGDATYKATVLYEITSVLAEQNDPVVYIDIKNERRPVIKTGAD